MESPSEKCPGSCLCGAITYEVKPPYSAFRYCHCPRCQKATGSAHASNLFVPQEQFAWLTGEDQITRFDLPEAKRFSVWFCKHCGSPVPHPIRQGDKVLVPAGSLDKNPGIKPEYGIWWSYRAPWYVNCADLTEHEEGVPH